MNWGKQCCAVEEVTPITEVWLDKLDMQLLQLSCATNKHWASIETKNKRWASTPKDNHDWCPFCMLWSESHSVCAFRASVVVLCADSTRLSENKHAWERNERKIRIDALTTDCEWRNVCASFVANHNQFAHLKQPQWFRTLIVQTARKEAHFERVKSSKITAKFSPHTRMLGYFPIKLTLYFVFNLDVCHHDQLHNAIYNVLLPKSASKLAELSDIKTSIWSTFLSPWYIFLVPPILGWEKTA